MQPSTDGVKILPWTAVSSTPGIDAAIDAIFFEASATKTFADEAVRAAFRERWLGRYLATFPEAAFIAVDLHGNPAGYIVGSFADPAQLRMFNDIGYFGAIAHLTSRFPAQLHVNLAPAWRGRGLGASLVERFLQAAKTAGAPGVHIVTARGMRNARFYQANGFREEGSFVWNGKELIFLARTLAGHDRAPADVTPA